MGWQLRILWRPGSSQSSWVISVCFNVAAERSLLFQDKTGERRALLIHRIVGDLSLTVEIASKWGLKVPKAATEKEGLLIRPMPEY